jgi:uncharacterized protein (DUF427 family)
VICKWAGKRNSSRFFVVALNKESGVLQGYPISKRIRRKNMAVTEKPKRIPGPDHPITVEPSTSRIVVSVAGRVIADTKEALTLREAKYPAVQYIPRKDVDTLLLERTQHTTYCPYKGECAYYSIPAGGDRSVNAVWSYEAPYESVSRIRDYVAFYPDRVDEIKVTG